MSAESGELANGSGISQARSEPLESGRSLPAQRPSLIARLMARTNLIKTLFMLGLRASGLLSKFLLTLFIAKEMSLAELGLYGLIAVGATIVPSVLGLGLNGPANRSCVGVPTAVAMQIASTRVGVTLLLQCIVSPLVLVGLIYFLPTSSLSLIALITATLILENLCSDFNCLLMARFKSTFAAVLLFIRSGAWPFAFILCAWFKPEFRTVEAIMQFWLGSLVLVMSIIMISASLNGYFKMLSFDTRLARDMFAKGRNFYVAEIGNAGVLYLDRYLVSSFLGLEATGIYTFFWSLTNAVNSLIFTAVTNPLAPKIVHAVNNGDKEGIRLACRKMFKEVGIWCVVLAVVMVGLLPWVLQYLNNSKLDQHQLVFAIMLLATLLRTVSEAADNVLYAHHQDRKIALVSIAAMAVSGLLILLLAPWFELPGVAVAMFGAALFVFSWRGLIARKLIAR